jgi:membrane fusion protein, multidrug efflux system
MNPLKSVLLVLPLLLMASVCMADEAVVHRIQAAQVSEQNVDEILHVYGKVSFDDAWLQNISLAYSGQIISLPVLAGEPVSKGQLLAEVVVDPAAAAAYQQAMSAVHFAQSEQARIGNLLHDQLATRSQLAAAQKALADSRSHLQQLKQQGLGKAIREIRAPFEAVVAAVPVQAGQRVPAGTTLLQLGHPDHLKVLLGVEPEDVRWISPGNHIDIHPAMSPGETVRASVDKVLHAVNPQTRLADMLVRLSGAQALPFLPGMEVSADVSARKFPNALVVPRQAVLYGKDNAAYVMRIENGKAIRVPVQVVFEEHGQALIQGAVKVGQQVATIGVAELADGDAVETVPAK